MALTLTHSVAVATSTYRAGIPSTRSRAHYECNGLTDNWPSWPRVRATSGRQAGRQRCAANCAATFNWQLLARSATFPLSIYDDDKRETGRQTDGQADGQTEGQAEEQLRGKTGGTY